MQGCKGSLAVKLLSAVRCLQSKRSRLSLCEQLLKRLFSQMPAASYTRGLVPLLILGRHLYHAGVLDSSSTAHLHCE